MGVEQELHRLWERADQEVLRQRLVEIVGDIRKDGAHSMLTLKLAQCVQVEPALRAMRNEVEDGLAVARDHDRLAFLNQARQRREAIFCFLDRYCGHARKIATGS